MITNSIYSIRSGWRLAFFCAALFFLSFPAQAGQIRDAEVEANLRSIADPIFTGAGLQPDQVHIVVIGEDVINAFVAEGQNLFLYAGLILEAKNVAQLGGVIAHESGHMAGGHLIRMRSDVSHASLESMVAVVAGLALGVGAGDANAGLATALGGGEFAKRDFLRNSRVFESSADASGMATLERMGLSAHGMAEFLEDLQGQEALSMARQSPYLLTHPLSVDRLSAVEAFVARSPNADKPWPAAWQDKFLRLQAKIFAFTRPAEAEQKYKGDASFVGRYATAIAAYRQGRIAEALTTLAALEKQEPQNPYLPELRGQIEFEQGKIPEAIAGYRSAVALAPKTGLLHLELAQALLQQDNAATSDAVTQLQLAKGEGEEQNSTLFHNLAIAYGRGGDEGHAKLSLAEEAIIKGDNDFAMQQAMLAKKLLQTDPAGLQRAEDLLTAANQAKRNAKKNDD